MRWALLLLVLVLMATPKRAWAGAAKHPLGARYVDAFTAAERRYGLPAGLLDRMAWQESRYNARAVSPVGAAGLMQFMPATAREFRIDPFEPYQSIDAAGRYVATLYRKFGDWPRAIAAYNWGMGNVARKGLTKAPAETREYYASILADVGLA